MPDGAVISYIIQSHDLVSSFEVASQSVYMSLISIFVTAYWNEHNVFIYFQSYW